MNISSTKPCAFSRMLLANLCILSAFPLSATTWTISKQDGDDAAAAADATGGTPFLHIQKAIDRAEPEDTIVIGDGVYGASEGVQTNKLAGGTIVSRIAVVSKGLTLRAENAGKTIIEGALDLSEDGRDGTGPNAVRCLYATVSNQKIVFDGITFRKGATDNSNAAVSWERRGAILVNADSSDVFLINCTVAECVSDTMGAVMGGTLVSCVMKNNRGINGSSAFQNGRAYLTLFADNVADNQPTAGYVDLMCCTFYGNVSSVDVRGTSATMRSSVTNCYAQADFKTYVDKENLVVDSAGTALNAPSAGDYRPIAGGIADVAAIGTLPDILPPGYTWSELRDVNGNAIDLSALRVGAIQSVAGKVLVTADKGGLNVSGAKIGTATTLAPGEKIVITPSGVATRPCAGVTVNGETILFDDVEDGRYTVTYEDLKVSGAAGISISAYYTNVWHMSPTGSDAASGFTVRSAKKNFSAVFSVAQENDIVRLEAGRYDYGDIMVSGDHRARAIVPKNVTLEGAGAGKSFIHGALATGAEDSDGCGEGAAVAVYLANGAKVRHCTLTEGRSAASGYGGGVVSANTTGTSVEFCIITNCVAYRGGGAHSSRLVNCLVTGCRCVGRAAGTYYCAHYNTAVVGNITKNETIMAPSVFDNSTVGGNEMTGSGSEMLVNVAGLVMRNSIVVGKVDANVTSFGEVDNNYAVVLGSGMSGLAAAFTLKTADELQIDPATGRPILGKNAGIGNGDSEKYDRELCGDVDLYGLPRVINGTMDVGALDADYRPIYLRDIGTKNGQILEFTSGILHDADNGRVTLGDGDRLVLSWWHKMSGNCELVFEIPEGGEALVELNGEVVEPVGGHYSFSVSADNSDVLSVSYAGPDRASFKVSDPALGMMLIVR